MKRLEEDKIKKVEKILKDNGYYGKYSEIAGFTVRDLKSKCTGLSGPVVQVSFGAKFHINTVSLRLELDEIEALRSDLKRAEKILNELNEVVPNLVE